MNQEPGIGLEQRIENAFSGVENRPLASDFSDRLVSRLADTEPSQPRGSSTLILSAYWLLAAIMSVVVLAQVGWVGMQFSASTWLAVMVALVSLALPVLILSRTLQLSVLDMIWRAIEG
jgi:hypothetical protein